MIELVASSLLLDAVVDSEIGVKFVVIQTEWKNMEQAQIKWILESA